MQYKPPENRNPRAGNAGANKSKRRRSYQNQPYHQRRFDPTQLPVPQVYYSGEGIRLSGKGVWRDAICPFHNDTRPSFRINIDNGAFRCMVCGAHGGNVLAFHMQRHGLRFADAVSVLGAWEGR